MVTDVHFWDATYNALDNNRNHVWINENGLQAPLYVSF
jgi:sensor domain CHASE-containing protein